MEEPELPVYQRLERPPHPRYVHEAGLRAYEQDKCLAESPSHVVAVVSGPKDMARRFGCNSITVAGAAPELSDQDLMHRLPVIPTWRSEAPSEKQTLLATR